MLSHSENKVKRNTIRRPFGFFLRGKKHQQQEQSRHLSTVDEKKESIHIANHNTEGIVSTEQFETDNNAPIFTFPDAFSSVHDPTTKDNMVSLCDSSISSWTTMNGSTRTGLSILHPFVLPSTSDDDEEEVDASISTLALKKIITAVMKTRSKTKDGQLNDIHDNLNKDDNVVVNEGGSITDDTLEKIITAVIKNRSKIEDIDEESKSISTKQMKEEKDGDDNDDGEGKSTANNTLENIVIAFKEEQTKAEEPQQRVKHDSTEEKKSSNLPKQIVDDINQGIPSVHSHSLEKSSVCSASPKVYSVREQLQPTIPSSSPSDKSVTNKSFVSSVKTSEEQFARLAAKALHIRTLVNGDRTTPIPLSSAIESDEVKANMKNTVKPQDENQLRGDGVVSRELDTPPKMNQRSQTPNRSHQEIITSQTGENEVSNEGELLPESCIEVVHKNPSKADLRALREDPKSLVVQDTFEEESTWELNSESTQTDQGINKGKR